MSAPPCIHSNKKCAVSVHLASHRFLHQSENCVDISARPSPVPTRPRSCGRFAPRATATRLELAARCTIWVPNHPPRLRSLCLPMLCTRAQVTSHAGSARSQCPSPPGPRIRRLFAHRTTSGCARLHKPSISSPPLSAAHHDVVGPRAVFADPCPPQVPSSSPPWPRSTTTSICRLSGCATPSMGRWRGAKCRHVTQMCVL